AFDARVLPPPQPRLPEALRRGAPPGDRPAGRRPDARGRAGRAGRPGRADGERLPRQPRSRLLRARAQGRGRAAARAPAGHGRQGLRAARRSRLRAYRRPAHAAPAPPGRGERRSLYRRPERAYLARLLRKFNRPPPLKKATSRKRAGARSIFNDLPADWSWEQDAELRFTRI